jgi:hypothetical protein
MISLSSESSPELVLESYNGWACEDVVWNRTEVRGTLDIRRNGKEPPMSDSESAIAPQKMLARERNLGQKDAEYRARMRARDAATHTLFVEIDSVGSVMGGHCHVWVDRSAGDTRGGPPSHACAVNLYRELMTEPSFQGQNSTKCQSNHLGLRNVSHSNY